MQMNEIGILAFIFFEILISKISPNVTGYILAMISSSWVVWKHSLSDEWHPAGL